MHDLGVLSTVEEATGIRWRAAHDAPAASGRAFPQKQDGQGGESPAGMGGADAQEPLALADQVGVLCEHSCHSQSVYYFIHVEVCVCVCVRVCVCVCVCVCVYIYIYI